LALFWFIFGVRHFDIMKSFLATSAFIASALACAFHDGASINAREWLSERRATYTFEENALLKRDFGEMRLIRTKAGESPISMTQNEVWALKRKGVKFMDVTEQDLEVEAKSNPHGFAAQAFPSGPTKQAQVQSVIANLSQANLVTYIDELSAFNNRYYKSQTGADAITALIARLNSIAATAPGTGGAISVRRFTHSWLQNSVIARIEGNGTAKDVTIAGAHIDSINLNSPTSGRAPGSDDDGSGCSNLIEVFRALVQTGFAPSSPIEFHFYSGEEGGLLGSQAIAKNYSSTKVPVKAMLQLDMTAYVKAGTNPTIAFITDHTSSPLTTYVRTLANAYVVGAGTNVTITTDQCGYACSDHASWDTAGYPSAFPFEGLMNNDNPNIHGTKDTSSVAQFSYAHMHSYSQLLTGFFIELAA
jgi:leucyl aminopeptidase